MSDQQSFYAEANEHNLVKTEIVTKYFVAWSKIMLSMTKTNHDNRIAYIDLFAGQGVFDDGSISTPIRILQEAISSRELCKRLVTKFNDADPKSILRLQQAIESLPGIEQLQHKPKLSRFKIGPEIALLSSGERLIPSLFFVDPFGYRGVSLELLGTTIQSWGCDCIFFFNYNRVNPAIKNPTVTERMNELFGANRADELRRRVETLRPKEREATILDEMSQALREIGGRHVISFPFESIHGKRTSHYVIFITKAYVGIKIMADIMFELSSDKEQIGSIGWVPSRPRQLVMELEAIDPLSELKRLILIRCAGLTCTVSEVHERCLGDKPYTFRHIQNALRQLEQSGEVVIDPPHKARSSRNGIVTLRESCRVTFPAARD